MKRFLLFAMSLLLCSALCVATADAQTRTSSSRRPAPPPPKPAPADSRPLDRGRLEGSTYTNDYFGVAFSVPKGWTIHDTSTMGKIQEGAKEIFSDDKANVKRALEASVERTTPLLSAAKFPPGAPEPFNASLVCAVELIPTALIKKPSDFYDVMLRSMKLSQGLEVEVIEPFRIKRIGAAEFGAYTLKLTTLRGMVLQKQLILIKGRYAVGIVYSYVDEADAKTFDEVLNSVRTK